MKTQLIVVATACSALALSSCTSERTELHKQPNIEVIQDMMDQPAMQPQDEDPSHPGVPASRLPPEGAIPVGYVPYKYKGKPQEAAANLKNPLAEQASPEILALGQRNYETYCLVCHGVRGLGDGPVSVKMSLKPPSLVSDKVRTMTDGGIFHIITDGQGVMASYAYQLVNEKERWAVVNYVRSLQKLTQGQAPEGAKTE